MRFGEVNLNAITDSLIVRGWDQTGSNGANLSFPEEFGLVGGPNAERNEWIVGVINAGYVSSFNGVTCLILERKSNLSSIMPSPHARWNQVPTLHHVLLDAG